MVGTLVAVVAESGQGRGGRSMGARCYTGDGKGNADTAASTARCTMGCRVGLHGGGRRGMED